MFTPTPRTTGTEPLSRLTPAVPARTAAARETLDMSRSEMPTPRQPAAASPDDWTRECLFDCYND